MRIGMHIGKCILVKCTLILKSKKKIFLVFSVVQASQVVLVVKNPPANAGDVRDTGSIPGLERSTGGGHGKPLQYSCLKNPMDKGAWRATVNGVAKSWTQLKWLSMHRTSKALCSCLGRAAMSSKMVRLSAGWPYSLESLYKGCLSLGEIFPEPCFPATGQLWFIL